MREYIRMMHAVWDTWQDGKPAQFLGKQYTYTLMTPNFNPGPLEHPRPKVGLAMVGPGMARTAGEVADVVMPHGGIMSDKYMREVLLPAIRTGLERGGRTWADLEIAESGYLILGDSDGEIEQKALGMRRALSFYGSTRTYHKVLALHGLEELGLKLHALSLRGRWDEMRDTVTVGRHPRAGADMHLRRSSRIPRRTPGVRDPDGPRTAAGDAGAGGTLPRHHGAGAGA